MKHILLLSAILIAQHTMAQLTLVKDLAPGKPSSSPVDLVVCNGKIFFFANNTANGLPQLWATDGSDAGTYKVQTKAGVLNQRSLKNEPLYNCVDNRLYYQAENDEHGAEPWVSDGTNTNTYMIKDVATGQDFSYPYFFVPFKNMVYFSARTVNHGFELYNTNGTEGNAVMVKDIIAGPQSSSPVIVNQTASHMFLISGEDLYITDGTENGTTLVKSFHNLQGIQHNHVSPTAVLGNKLIFTADDGVNGWEPWVSDGTVAGTFMLYDTDADPNAYYHPTNYMAYNNLCYFTVSNKLYETDGTKAGTKIVGDYSEKISSLTAAGNKLYILTQGGLYVKATGTVATGLLVKDGLSSIADDRKPCIANGNLYFIAGLSAIARPNIWVSDGSVAGTAQLTDVPGLAFSYTSQMVQMGNAIYLTASLDVGANDPQGLGNELYKLSIPPLGLPQVAGSNQSITIYPNPANNTLNIDLPQAGKCHVSVMSITGQVLLQQEVADAHNALNISTLPVGLFVVALRDGGGSITTYKFVKE